MTTKEKYQKHCITNSDIPLFLTYKWMQATCKDSWDVTLKESGEEIQGILVFHIKKKMGQKYITMPHLTPYSGVWINYPEGQKKTTKISFERKVMEALIDQLPKIDFCVLHLYPTITNWQPFYWKDFKQTSRYTYIIDGKVTVDDCYNNLRENIRREIKKAEKNLVLESGSDFSVLHKLKQASTANSQEPLSFSASYLENIKNTFTQNCELLIAKSDNNIVAAVLLVHDSNSTYYLSGAVLPEYKTSGALSLLLWKGVQSSLQQNKAFNFEGSMIKAIERYFSSFGAEQVPYHRITKTNSLIAKTKEIIADI